MWCLWSGLNTLLKAIIMYEILPAKTWYRSHINLGPDYRGHNYTEKQPAYTNYLWLLKQQFYLLPSLKGKPKSIWENQVLIPYRTVIGGKTGVYPSQNGIDGWFIVR